MKRISVYAVGRIKDAALVDLCTDYCRRCSQLVHVDIREFKDLDAAQRAIGPRTFLVALDERGVTLTSREFASHLKGWINDARSEIAFLIGGSDGLNTPLRSRANFILSLGKMTFAHRLARLMVAEQIYRAISIIQGTPYHRE